MTDHDYEYELMRAELLGLPPPEKTERKPPDECEEELNTVASEDVELDGEQMGKVSGGLDELNSILAITQRKINRFKMVCGSFTNLLKIRVGKDNATSESASLSSLNSQSESAITQENTGKSNSSNDVAAGSTETNTSPSSSASSPAPIPVEPPAKKTPKARDLEGKLTAQMDVLDRMVMKAEQAEMSMNQQNKQMRRFLQ